MRQVEGVLSMDQITDRIQPVSHPVLLPCAPRIRAGQRAAAGQATRAGAGLATHHVSGPVSSRGPLGPRGGPAFAALFTDAAGLLAVHLPGLSDAQAVAVLMAAMAVPAGDRHVEAGGTRAGSGVAGVDGRIGI